MMHRILVAKIVQEYLEDYIMKVMTNEHEFPTDKKYSVIYADPPWNYINAISAAKHYNTMSTEDICKLPVKDITTDNAILFLWATYPNLKEAFKVIEAWGFEYKTLGFQWVKLSSTENKFFFGLGNYTRANSEPCLIGIKGKPKIVNSSISQIICTPIREHSRKPDEVRDKIVSLMGLDNNTFIELFARQSFPNWDCWGNEVHKFDTVIDNKKFNKVNLFL